MSMTQTASVTTQAYQDRHYTVAEVAEMWGLSENMVRKIFYREPGVIILGNDSSSSSKRRYTTARIPESVILRVHKRFSII